MQYDTLLIGATCLSAGYAVRQHRNGKTCAILESASIPGSEFASALLGSAVPAGALSPEGEQLRRELTARHAVSPAGILHIPALTPMLAQRLQGADAAVYFMSTVLDIRRDGDGFAVTGLCMGTVFCLRARQIIDTTAVFLTRGFFAQPAPDISSSLRFLMESPAASPSIPVSGTCYGEGVLGTLDCLPQESVIAATARLLRLRRQSPSRFGGARLMHIAMQMAEIPAEAGGRRFAGDAAWLPSTGYPDGVSAFEAGVRAAEAGLSGLPAAVVPLPVHQDAPTDLIVAGLGTAGAVAAVLGGKRGLRTLGLEPLPIPGGAGTAGNVLWNYQGQWKDGYYRKLDAFGQEFCSDLFVCRPECGGGVKRLMGLQEGFCRFDVDTRFGVTVIGVLSDGEKHITGVRYLAPDGIHEVAAKEVIDATGDGAVCRLAGCEMLRGRESDGLYMPFSSAIATLDRKTGQYNMSYTDGGMVDQYDPAALGREMLRAGTMALHLRDSYDTPVLFYGGSLLLGLREGQRIVGEETVTFADAANGIYTDHPMFYMVSNIDGHSKDFVLESSPLREWYAVAGLWGHNLKLPVPAGILIPKGYTGLLAAGRHVSCDHSLSYALRMMDDLCRCSEAAVLLAEYAIRTGKPEKEMPYPVLRAGMLEHGALREDDAPGIWRQGDTTPFRTDADWFWLREDEIEAGLRSDRPGLAMWSCRRMGSTMREQLTVWAQSAEGNLRANAALTLALCGFGGGEAVLLELMEDTGGYTPLSSKMYNPTRAVSAIVACGMLGLTEAIPVLVQYITDLAYGDRQPLVLDSVIYDREDLRFQYRAAALTALCEILRQHPECTGDAAHTVQTCLAAPDFHVGSTLMGDKTYHQDLTQSLRTVWNQAVPGYRV